MMDMIQYLGDIFFVKYICLLGQLAAILFKFFSSPLIWGLEEAAILTFFPLWFLGWTTGCYQPGIESCFASGETGYSFLKIPLCICKDTGIN